MYKTLSNTMEYKRLINYKLVLGGILFKEFEQRIHNYHLDDKNNSIRLTL